MIRVVYKLEVVKKMFKETVFDGERVVFKKHVPTQASPMKGVIIMDLNLDDEKQEVGKDAAAFDPDVKSMRSKMPADEEEEEEDVTLFPTFKTPQEITYR